MWILWCFNRHFKADTVLEWNETKRQQTLTHCGLDFANAGTVFSGPHHNIVDDRQDYGEPRIITVGYLDERMVVMVWTLRGETRRIISMRKANEREQKLYG